MSQENKQLVIDHIALSWNAGQYEECKQLISPSFYYQTTFTNDILNRDEYIKFIISLREAIPDLMVEVEDIMSEGDRVITHTSFIGTVNTPVFGLPASDRIIAFPAASFWGVSGGKIKSLNTMINISDVERQVGTDVDIERPLPIK